MTSRFRVAAAVLVHDAVQSAQRVVDCLAAQSVRLSQIVVVDNAGKEPLSAALHGDIHVVRSDENLGVGAGHELGWQAALRDPEVTHIWVLEHDTYPEPTCLEELLTAASADPLSICVPRLERNREEAEAREVAVVTAPPTATTRMTFNGVLVPRAVVERVGMPDARFFVGGEDLDYAARVSKSGLRLVKVFSALALHPTKGNRRHNVSTSPLRSYYSTRNWMFLELAGGNRSRAVWCWTWCVASLAKIALKEDKKVARAASRFVATYDAVRGRMGPRDYWFFRA